MDIVLAEIHLYGDIRASTVKEITVPEIAVVRGLHGRNSVAVREKVGSVKRSEREEKHRLTTVYGKIVETIYPGEVPRMDMELATPAASKPARKTTKKKAAADATPPAPAAAPGDSDDWDVQS